MNRKKYGGTQPRFLPIWMHKLWIVLGCTIGIGLIGTGIGLHYYRNYVAMDYDMRSKDILWKSYGVVRCGNCGRPPFIG